MNKNSKYLVKLNRNNTSFTRKLFEYLKKATWSPSYNFLKYYQNLVRIFINEVDIDSRGQLCIHEMGLGKSILAIALAIDLIKERQPIILLTKSLQENMRNSIFKYVKLRAQYEPDFYLCKFSEQELSLWIDKNFSFVSMNASNMLKQMSKAAEGHSTEEFDAVLEKKMGEITKLVSLDGKLLIVDEAHNLFRAITNGSKNGQGLYDMVMKAKNLKIIFLTGTPISNDPFELVPCFNMIGSQNGTPILPESYKEFNKLFVDEKNGRIKNKEKFQNRIMGLVSFVNHLSKPGHAFELDSSSEVATADLKNQTSTTVEFPQELPLVVEKVNMNSEQYVIYQLARDKEKEEGSSKGKFTSRGVGQEPPNLTKPKGKASSTYRVKSRQLGNFCPPANLRGKDQLAIFESEGINVMDKILPVDLESPKFRKIYDNILKHKNQPGLVYSQFVGMGGLGTFSRYLESKGWKKVNIIHSGNKKTNFKKLEELEPSIADGLQDELDEYVGANNERIMYGSAIPSIDDILKNIDDEMLKHGGLEDTTEDTTENDVLSWWLDVDNTDNTNNDDLPIDSLLTDNKLIEFRYATINDLETIKKINPACNITSDSEFPKNILLILENSQPTGYVNISYETKTGKIVSDYLDKVSPDLSASVIKKIISDAINCDKQPDEFKKPILGGTVDITGAINLQQSDHVYNYAIISGEVDVSDRSLLADMFNNGDINLILVSSTGAEGLDLKNGRHVHIMEPYWNWSRIRQIISRFVRNDSHKTLPEDEKNVQPYIYLSIPPESERNVNGGYSPTTDIELYEESLIDHAKNESFFETIREVSIECLANDEKYCRSCNPTDQPLFTDDPARDIRSVDPCTEVKEMQILAQEVIVNGIKYYFTPDATSLYDYKIFEFDPNVNSFRPLKESDPRYATLVEIIITGKKETDKT